MKHEICVRRRSRAGMWGDDLIRRLRAAPSPKGKAGLRTRGSEE